jgi:hypothetical protein
MKGGVRWLSIVSLTPAFKAVQKKIAKRYGMKRAGAILASATRKASAKAKRRNPRLKRVKGRKRK